MLFQNAIFNFVLILSILRSSNENAFRWMPSDLTDDKPTLVQVMAWCRQATSHYLSQYWARFMSLYGIIRPQWVNHLVSYFFFPTNLSLPLLSWAWDDELICVPHHSDQHVEQQDRHQHRKHTKHKLGQLRLARLVKILVLEGKFMAKFDK